MIRLAKTRFGDIDVDDARAVTFPRGLIGFPEVRRFVLLEPRGRAPIAWLQSLDTPELAFPVVDGATFGDTYPQPKAQDLARDAGIGDTDLALLVIVAAVRERKGLIANMLAPLIVDMVSRTGAQVVLDYKSFSASAPLTTLGAQPAA